MSPDLVLALELFHFLRPWLLAGLLPVAGLWWLVRRRLAAPEPAAAGLAPHLRRALTLGRGGLGRLLPIDGVALALALAVLGAAGPTWSRQPDPFVSQTAPLVIVLKLDPSMAATDVLPSRLERGKQKIRDLLALRAGARSALVAYAGTAHAVVPMTEDPQVMLPYLEGLTPEVMPRPGDDPGAALALALEIMAGEPAPGGVLFVTDGIASAGVAPLNAATGASLAVLALLPEGRQDPGLAALEVPLVPVRADAGDIRQLERGLNAAYRRALAAEGDQPWEDRGGWLAWPVALLTLGWFRRGWTMRWTLAAALALAALLPAGGARAGGPVDWFLTADQQGQIAYGRRDFERAAQLFADPAHQAEALFRDGQYAAAVRVLEPLDTAWAAMLQGMALIRDRNYRAAIAAFETAVARDPDYPGAAGNLAVARQILDYVETAREQSDTGEEQGIGADEVVFDNEGARGADTEIEGGGAAEVLSAEQWMNTVDTRTGDFLRQRFAIEAARR